MDTDGHSPTLGLVERLRRLLSGRRAVLSERDLHEIIEDSEQAGIIHEGEGEMLHSIFTFGDTIVREIMVPRTGMVSCPTTVTLDELLVAIISSGHSRIPIYEGSNDRIVGVIYAKDLLRYWGQPESAIRLAEIMREPYFVPETKNIEALLQEFRTKRVHMAIAIDEYGGTSGLITIEDLIEEIIGDIQDEYDLEEEWLVEGEDGSLLVDGRLNIDELERHFELSLAKENVDTVGGYLSQLCGHVPQPGETVEANGLAFAVVDADERKLRRARVRRSTPRPAEPAE